MHVRVNLKQKFCLILILALAFLIIVIITDFYTISTICSTTNYARILVQRLIPSCQEQEEFIGIQWREYVRAELIPPNPPWLRMCVGI